MELSNSIEMSEDEFCERVLNELQSEGDFSSTVDSFIVFEETSAQTQSEKSNGNDSLKKPGAKKRRANLTEFDESETTKRKNETAKRELTSIVKQLTKIDKQLNTKDDVDRASISFVATFSSFKSNRINTFKYPPDAEIKPMFMGFNDTMTAVQTAVKEAMSGLLPRKNADVALASSSEASFLSVTPTKTIAAFSSIPSPVTVKKMPTSSKNLCAKNSCTFGKKIRKPVWVRCSHSIEGQSCSYHVHAPCIGFPSIKEGKVELLLKGWCCPDHTVDFLKKK